MPANRSPFYWLLRLGYCLLCTCGCISHAAAQDYLYQYLTVKDGLPSDYVMSIYFDRSGILWMGTDKGLCRFDGASASNISTDEGLGNNMVYAIVGDEKGFIWAGGSVSGLNKISYSKGKPVVEKIVQKPRTIYKVLKDETGWYWIKTNLPKTTTLQLCRTRHLDSSWQLVAEYKENGAVDITEDGTVYVLAGAWIRWAIPYNQVFYIHPKADERNGILYASGKKCAFFSGKRTVLYSRLDSTALLYQDQPLVAGVYARFFHFQGKDLIYKTGSRSYLFNNGKLLTLVNNSSNADVASRYFTAASDTHHQLYLSEFGKGLLMWRSPYAVSYSMPDKVGRIITTPTGIALNCGSHIFRHENVGKILSEVPFVATNLKYITQDKTGNLIISGSNEFYSLNGKQWIQQPDNFVDLSDLIFSNGVYYGSSYSTGIHKIKGEEFDTTWKQKLNLPYHGVERLFVYDKYLYALTLSKGLFEIDTATLATTVYDQQKGLPSNSVFCMYKEKDTVWAGTSKGFARIHAGKITNWKNADGFNGSKTLCIFRDQHQRLWILSDQFLHLVVDGKLYPIKSCPILTDDSYVNTAIYDQRTNTLWIGTSKKLLAVNMGKISPDRNSYALSIDKIWVNNKAVSPFDGKLELNSGTENIQIHFANPHVSLYSKPDTYVRLQNYQEEWQLLNGSYVLNLQKLPPGTYTLQTKTIGPDMGFAINDQQLVIKILQPWYFRLWFIILVLVLVTVLAFVMSRMIAKRKYEAELKLVQAEQALELERMRISRELHDNVGSMLTLVINKLADSPMVSVTEQEQITGIARHTLSQLRDAIWALDKSNISMTEWINHTKQHLQQLPTNNISIKSQFDFPATLVLTPLKALHSFRIIQEALTNALKHAKAKKIVVKGTINAKNEYELIVEDDGMGFQQELTKKGYGLKNISKRAAELGGKLVIDSKPDIGTVVKVTWPV